MRDPHVSQPRSLRALSRPLFTDFTPGATAGWGGRQYDARLLELLDDETFRLVFMDFAFEFRVLFNALEARARDEFRLLHRLAAAYLIDRRLSEEWQAVTRPVLDRERHDAVRGDHPAEAERIAAQITRLWPLYSKSWSDRAATAAGMGEHSAAIEVMQHALDLPGVALRELEAVAVAHRDAIATLPEGAELLERLASAA